MMRELAGSNPGCNNLESTQLAHVVVYRTMERKIVSLSGKCGTELWIDRNGAGTN